MSSGRSEVALAGFLAQPQATLIWGPHRRSVNGLAHALGAAISAEFLRLEVVDPDGRDEIDPSFETLPADRNIRLAAGEELRPDTAARNLSVFVRAEGADDETQELLLPPPLRALLSRLMELPSPRALLVTGADRLGDIGPEIVSAFGEVDRFLKTRGVFLVVAHCGAASPTDRTDWAFDVVLEVRSTGSEPARVVGGSSSGSPLLPAGRAIQLDVVLRGLPPAPPGRSMPR